MVYYNSVNVRTCVQVNMSNEVIIFKVQEFIYHIHLFNFYPPSWLCDIILNNYQ